jgi:AcrR family transcriptional regulator
MTPVEKSCPTLTSKGEATRQRIMAAATAEFAQRGIAGARVDRIAAEAATNKAQLYAYFGSKDQLFDSVFMASMKRITDVVPISAEDLADWAVRLYDEYVERPDLIRLATWARLERQPTGHLLGNDRIDDHKLSAIASAQKSGAISDVAGRADPFDVMAMVIAMSMAWSPVSNVYAATADEPARVHRQRRDLLREAVRRAFAPPAH